ncbi:MAG: DUF2752 domain-containing protein [Phycisphaerales bacterium]|nr:DUF2752 domain-containing protein [Phycisphaerales bacterium]
MKPRLVTASRRLPVPWWIVAIVVLWGGSVMALELWRTHGGDAPITCTLRRATGIPCGTCGSTRAVFSLAQGDAASALRYNPFVTIGGAALAGVGVMRIGFGKRLNLGLGTHGRRIAWCLVGAAFIANWAYIIAYHRGIVADPAEIRTAAALPPSTPLPQP